jgi:hypothetical protein
MEIRRHLRDPKSTGQTPGDRLSILEPGKLFWKISELARGPYEIWNNNNEQIL